MSEQNMAELKKAIIQGATLARTMLMNQAKEILSFNKLLERGTEPPMLEGTAERIRTTLQALRPILEKTSGDLQKAMHSNPSNPHIKTIETIRQNMLYAMQMQTKLLKMLTDFCDTMKLLTPQQQAINFYDIKALRDELAIAAGNLLLTAEGLEREIEYLRAYL